MAAIGLATLAVGPFALLFWQRAVSAYDRDPLNWEWGNHGPWWTSRENAYLGVNLLAILLVLSGVRIRALVERCADGHRWPRWGCWMPVSLFALFVVHVWFLAATCI